MKLVLVSAMSSNPVWRIPYAALRLQAALQSVAGSSSAFPLHVQIICEPAADLEDTEEAYDRYRGIFGEADVVGFSVYVWNRGAVEGLAERLARQEPRPVLIAGGPETESDSRRLSELFDLVIPGEGEEVLSDVLSRLYRGESTEAIRAGIRKSAVRQPGLLPSPYVNNPGILEGHTAVLWELSRGCPYRCAFCFESKGFRGVRRFDEDTAAKELKLFRQSGVNQVFVLDPTFNHDRRRAVRILGLIASEAPDMHFTFEVRAELLDEHMVECFSRITCALQIGLQSSDRRVLKTIHRNFDPAAFERNVELLNDYGVVYGFDLIYGLPGDTLDGFFLSFDYALSLLPNHLDIFPLSILPGTVLCDRALSLGLERPENAPYHFLPRAGFGGDDIQAARNFEAAFDAFYNKGKAVSWIHLLTEFLEITPSDFFKALPAPEPGLLGQALFDYQLRCIGIFLSRDEYPDEYAVVSDIVRYYSHENTAGPEGSYDSADLAAHLESGVTDIAELAAFVKKRHRD
ncbi:MAG: radical SAM protein [Spirochaetales bacterium]|nr:radical SAM protein [Spirochaetales bacterium]